MFEQGSLQASNAIELSGLCDSERSRSSSIRDNSPVLEDGVPLTQLENSRSSSAPLGAGPSAIEKNGLTRLAWKERNGKDERKLLPELQKIFEALAFSRPKLSVAADGSTHQSILKSEGTR